MTLPDERYRAVLNTRKFLVDLCNPKATPRIPKEIRQQANWCLRHYPSQWDLDQAAEGAPHVFQEQMEVVTRLFKKYEETKATKE